MTAPVKMRAEEWCRSYAGLCIQDDGDHWTLTWFGQPFAWGLEEHMEQTYAYLCRRLAEVLESSARERLAERKHGRKA